MKKTYKNRIAESLWLTQEEWEKARLEAHRKYQREYHRDYRKKVKEDNNNK